MISESSFTTTSSNEGAVDKKAASKKISAYYSLVFPNFTFYIQTLSVTIGRRCSPTPHASSSSSSGADTTQVDVDLGALKSVSRLHAKIEYDSEQDHFVLAVIGRNGAWVDGVWSGSGTRAVLGERSQIQIASRTFEFVLPPPPPPPDDSPSPSSNSSSGRRRRSPSLDITSMTPPSSHSPPLLDDYKPLPDVASPPPAIRRPPAPPEPQLPNSNSISRSTKNKKRKKNDLTDPPAVAQPEEKPRPEEIPPKPAFTYSQLIYRAIKALDNKATLQEICAWIAQEFSYYRYTDGNAWMSSVRHNLSSSKAFKKLERCGGDRGKGFFWALDEDHQHIIEEQEAKSQQQAAQASASGSKSKKKEKGTPLSEPPFKRSVKGDAKGSAPTPLLTSTPRLLPSKAANATPAPAPTPPAPTTTSVFAYQLPGAASTSVTSGYSGTPISGPNPYAALTQSNWRIHTKVIPMPVLPSSNPAGSAAPVPPSTQMSPPPLTPTPAPPPSAVPAASSGIPDVPIPIVLGPIPSTHTDYSPSHPNNSAKEGYMILHERKLVLDPRVFSDLTPEIIADLEKMGARQALDVLMGHMVRVLKQRRKAKKNAKVRGKNAGGTKRKDPPGEAPSAAPALPTAASETTVLINEDIIVNIEDSDGDEPAAKKRKVEQSEPQAADASV